MVTDGLPRQSHLESIGALRRAARRRAGASLRLSDLVKFIAVVGIGGGLGLEPIAPALLVTGIGAAALWLCFLHDDAAVERRVLARLDPLTGLPSADDLDIVLGDELVACSIAGRIAVIAVDVTTISSRDVTGHHARTLTTSISGRLEGGRWLGGDTGPYDPFVFVEHPGRFLVVLRDVIDDRTTWWLARRLRDVVNAPVPIPGLDLDPGAVVSLAVGNAGDWPDLVPRVLASTRGTRNGPDDRLFPGPSDPPAVDTRHSPSRSAQFAKAATIPSR